MRSFVHSTPRQSNGIRLCLFHRVEDYPGCLTCFYDPTFSRIYLKATEQVAPGAFVPGYVFGKQSTLTLPSSLGTVNSNFNRDPLCLGSRFFPVLVFLGTDKNIPLTIKLKDRFYSRLGLQLILLKSTASHISFLQVDNNDTFPYHYYVSTYSRSQYH